MRILRAASDLRLPTSDSRPLAALGTIALLALLLGACLADFDLSRLRDGGFEGTDADGETDGGADADGDTGEVPVTCGNGTVDPGEDCDGDPPQSCTTSCGSTGTQACVGCAWDVCTPPYENCNGDDDDCDTETDEGYPCIAGASVACTAPCGVAGTGLCGATASR